MLTKLAIRIRNRRKQRNLSQEELAARVGTSQGQISSYERSENEPTGHVIGALAQALETTADWLLGLTDEVEVHLDVGDLAPKEVLALDAWRRGDRAEAAKVILNDVEATIG